MSNFETNITADYLKKSASELKEINEQSYALMELENARRALDVGCGPGLDLSPIAALMPPDGKVTGLDLSVGMLAKAAEFVKNAGMSERVNLVQGSAIKLPFPDEYFDAVRAMRLYQVLPQDTCPPDRVFAEQVRVLRKGGRLVLVDMDWSTASVDFPDLALERRLVGFFAEKCRPHGYAGRKFKGWMADAGFTDIQARAYPRFMEQVDDCPLGTWLTDEAVKQGAATAQEASYWMDYLREQSARKAMYASANMLIVSGRKVS